MIAEISKGGFRAISPNLSFLNFKLLIRVFKSKLKLKVKYLRISNLRIFSVSADVCSITAEQFKETN